MAKDKEAEALYKAEGNRRMLLRKERRIERLKEKQEQRSRYCRGCGEDPYCYCGDGTPYSY